MGLLQDYEDHFEEKIAKLIRFLAKKVRPCTINPDPDPHHCWKGSFQRRQHFYSRRLIFRLAWHNKKKLDKLSTLPATRARSRASRMSGRSRRRRGTWWARPRCCGPCRRCCCPTRTARRSPAPHWHTAPEGRYGISRTTTTAICQSMKNVGPGFNIQWSNFYNTMCLSSKSQQNNLLSAF